MAAAAEASYPSNVWEDAGKRTMLLSELIGLGGAWGEEDGVTG